MDRLAHIPVPLAVAFAVSLVLAVVNWALTTGGQQIRVRDGLGGHNTYSRFEIAALPPLFIGLAGAFFLMDDGTPEDVRYFVGLWIVGVLGTQVFLIAAALKRRGERKAKRKELFGE